MGNFKDTDLAFNYFNIGNSKVLAGEYKKAIKAYTRAIGIVPQHAAAYYNRGVSKVKLKDYLFFFYKSHGFYKQSRLDHEFLSI